MKSATWLAGTLLITVMVAGLSLVPNALSYRQALAADSTMTVTTSPTATVTPTPTPCFCPEHGPFRVEVIPSSERLLVGETLEIGAYLYNETEYTYFGRPEFRPTVWAEEGDPPALEPVRPEPVTYWGTVGAGGSIRADFTFQSVRPGIVRINVSITGELGCYNCYYDNGFASGTSSPITVIEPYEAYLPLVSHNRVDGVKVANLQYPISNIHFLP